MLRVFSIGLVAMSLFSAGADAATYNLTADWSTTNNPNGPWTYRGDTTPLPTFFPNHMLDGPSGVWASGNTDGNFLPGIFKATDTQLNWIAGDVVAHTPDLFNGPSFTNVNVLFTAPIAGTANISGLVWNARDFGRSQGWTLSINGVTTDSGTLPGDGSDGRSSPDIFSELSVSLLAGDTIVLSLFGGAPSGVPLGDYVGLDLTVDLNAVNPVPLPAALPLFVTIVTGGGLIMWRKKRTAAKAAAA